MVASTVYGAACLNHLTELIAALWSECDHLISLQELKCKAIRLLTKLQSMQEVNEISFCLELVQCFIKSIELAKSVHFSHIVLISANVFQILLFHNQSKGNTEG